MTQQGVPFDHGIDRSATNLAKDDSISRRHHAGSSAVRNKSYDFLMSNKSQAKGGLAQQGQGHASQKAIISMWGYVAGLGMDENFEKIGEIDEEIADISFSDGHVFLLTEGNNILVRGKNDSKQLGFDPKETLLSFKVLSLPSTVKYVKVECGGDFTFALGREGEVFSWGLNIKGQLGHGHFEPVSSAAQLRYLTYSNDSRSPRVSRRSKDGSDDIKLAPGEKVVDVSCGALHSLLLTNKGRIFGCGYNETCALGNGGTENQCTFTEIPFFSSSQLYDKTVTRLASGVSHSACLVQDTAYVWGTWGSKPNMIYTTPTAVPLSGNIGFGNQASDQVIDVRLGDLLTVFLTVKGDVFTLGDNINGQLGIGDRKEPLTSPVRVPLESPVSNISCGANHVFCYTKDCKSVFAWGSNLQQQVSVSAPTTKKFSSPLKITHLLSSLTTRIVCRSRGTVAISKLPINPQEMKEMRGKAYKGQRKIKSDWR
jgi:alpha-tubulin suppressor-like RCC1 family protein